MKRVILLYSIILICFFSIDTNAQETSPDNFPITLSNSQSSIVIEWITEPTTLSNMYIIERSNDGHNWEHLNDIQVNNKLHTTYHYQYADDEVIKNATYYYKLTALLDNGDLLQSKSKIILFNPNSTNELALH